MSETIYSDETITIGSGVINYGTHTLPVSSVTRYKVEYHKPSRRIVRYPIIAFGLFLMVGAFNGAPAAAIFSLIVLGSAIALGQKESWKFEISLGGKERINFPIYDSAKAEAIKAALNKVITK